MPAGPPPRLEAIVGLFLPPVCREEVLGDLRETYSSAWQYAAQAIHVIPCVFFSRVRRTTDVQLLLTQTLLIYGAFLAGGWYSDRRLTLAEWGLLWPAIPTAANIFDLVFEKAWAGGSKWLPRLVWGAALGLGIAVSPFGYLVGWVLARAAAIVFASGVDMRQGAHGSVLHFNWKDVPIARPKIMRDLLTTAGALALVALFFAAVGHKPESVLAIVVFVVMIVFRNS